MILESLVKYYEALVKLGRVAPIGFSTAKAVFALCISKEGDLVEVMPLNVEEGRTIKYRPTERLVPRMVKRTSGAVANFLCDNGKFMLGIDQEGGCEHTQKSFKATKAKHLDLLESVDSDVARAVLRFFEKWDPDSAYTHPVLAPYVDAICEGGNLIFNYEGIDVQDYDEIREAWAQRGQVSDDAVEGICLVTGKKGPIARTHTSIKGVAGAQSTGAALVTFNEDAFCYRGKKQGYNSPVGAYAEFAYTTALNYLLSRKEYKIKVGDTTVLFWSEDGDDLYQEVFSWIVESRKEDQELLGEMLKKMASGEPMSINGRLLDGKKHFYVLALAPNVTRLSIRFFYRDTFGSIIDHVIEHYDRLEVIKPSNTEIEYIGLWRLLRETVNLNSQNKDPMSSMAASVFHAIVSGTPYPASLYSNALIRIRAEQGRITFGRAAIIKAYLIRNHNWTEGEDFVMLNEASNDRAYVLGRMFATLELIQKDSGTETIKERYFNAACATPYAVFPLLMRMKNHHIRKIKSEGLRIRHEQLITDLMGRLDDYPKRLGLAEQGRFMLGYYHQIQKRYTKREAAPETEEKTD